MLPKYHITIGAIVSLFIYSIYEITILQATIIFLSSFLIDFDHYLLYVINKKDLSLQKARKFFFKRREIWINLPISKRKDHKRFIFIFHGIECWIILAILAAYLHPIFWFILLGIAIHIFLDYIDLIYLGEPLYSKVSQLYVYHSNKKKKYLKFNH